MIKLKLPSSTSLSIGVLILLSAFAAGAQMVPAPREILGFTPGDDRKLASWAQTLDYFKKLDAASDRVMFEEIGKTTMGAPFVYATISSPANLKNLAKYKRINDELADPRKLLKYSVREIAQLRIGEGKTIVLITCGIHSTEVGSHHSSFLIAHRLASSNEPEIKKILDNTIVLLVPSLNPDGVDIVKKWYDKTLGTPYEGTNPPELYHKYVGHDNNRDWYAFTQIETQLTVDKIHNVWHPQIVHDIHQQGEFGSRLFLPPYMQPVEPNVPKQIVEGYTELGNFMAADLRKKGFEGITTNSTYDAWTPARAYSHYHGGVRILSETASAKLATPINVKYDELRNGLGYDVRKETANFGPVWKGGEWHLRDITNYMTKAAFSLLNHAADNREKWLSRFYEIGKDSVRPRKGGELVGLYIPESSQLENILQRGGVEVVHTERESFIGLAQPYSAFAKALLETQEYPNLKDEKGNPIPPYDVTAHSLHLLTGDKVRAVTLPIRIKRVKTKIETILAGCDAPALASVMIYKSHIPAIDEGWTRWTIKEHAWGYWSRPRGKMCTWLRSEPTTNSGLLDLALFPKSKTIIFPDQSPNQILNGYAKGSMPDEYTGGVGKEGVENLKKFVEAGGTLVFLNRASDFAIEQFNLPIRDVTKGLPRKDFYIPGSILRTELDLTSPIAKGMPKESIAWFENGPVFEEVRVTPLGVKPGGSPSDTGITTEPSTNSAAGTSTSITPKGVTLAIRVIARYPADPEQILLSGWALGADKIAGKAALIELAMGKGKIILFGFRPQYRGQSLATFPLLFNAISN